MTNLDEVSNRLGHVESSVEHMDRRLNKVDEKLDRMLEKFAVIDHMRNNIAMMKKPVEDYQRVKERGLGMWTLLTFLLGAATVVFNLISYLVRAKILGLGG